MILNQNVDFSSLPMEHQNAFIQRSGAGPTKDLIPQGTRLYKFNGDTNLSFNDRVTGKPAMSQWWSPYNEYKHDAGWGQKLNMARHFGVSIREYGRVTSAVKENWNSLEFLLEITLNVPVYGFFGGFASMSRVDVNEDKATGGKTVATSRRMAGEGSGGGRLPGGATQFYIPNLTPDLVQSWSITSLANM